ncbi:MAG: hypothetical protein R2705_20675 [Ilumatobacteraceae bacterium]
MGTITSTAPARPTPRAVRRPAPAGRSVLLLAAGGMIIGSFLPWVQTGFGMYRGVAGAGLWTFYVGVLALAGALVPVRWVALGHALVAGAVAVSLPAWQFLRLFRRVGFTGWSPGTGLWVVFVAGIAALVSAWQTWRRPVAA